MYPTSLLLIDDDPAYCLQLQTAGRVHRFEIEYHHNLENGIEALMVSRRIKAVILDGRCFLEPGQQGVARTNFVYHAMQRIKDVEKEFNRVIPYCVNTGNLGDFREDLDGIAPVFQKIIEQQALFDWLKNAVAQLPEMAIRKRYADIFEKTAVRFTVEEEDLLIDVLQSAGISDFASIITSLALLRRLLERLIDIACFEKLHKHPLDFSAGSGSRTKRILEAMQQCVLPSELFVSANRLYNICSKFGNHQGQGDNGEVPFKPAKYTLQRLIYAYLELTEYLLDEP